VYETSTTHNRVPGIQWNGRIVELNIDDFKRLSPPYEDHPNYGKMACIVLGYLLYA